MKKYISLLLIVALALALFPAFPGTAKADDYDFEVEYEFYPETVGYMGAEIGLTVKVKNLSSAASNITDVNVVINTNPVFNESVAVHPTIAPGYQRTFSFTVPFSAGDLNVRKGMVVAVKRHASFGGVQTFSFEIEGKEKIFDVEDSTSVSGDTITIGHEFTNTITTHAALHVQTRVSMYIEGDNVYTGPVEDHGTIFPGASFSTSFHYTFGEDEYGSVVVEYQIACTIVGAGYSYNETWTAASRAAPPPPDITFTAALYAEPTEIDAGDEVTLRIALGNTGDDAIETFEVRNAEGGLEATTENLPAGGAGSVTLTERFYETSTISYVVVGRTGDDSVSHETNAVTITVRREEAAASETPEASAGPTPTETPIEMPAAAAATQEPEPAASEEAEAISEAGAADNDMLYMIIAALAVLVLAGILVLILILRKKK